MNERAVTGIRAMRISFEVWIMAAPDAVFAALTERVDAWWTYRFRPPCIVRLEPWVGGRFIEEWDGAEGVRYATVTRVQPGVLLSLSGSMGMTEPTDGEIHFVFVATHGGTEIALTHRASGVPDGIEEQYRYGWETLLRDCLKPFVEVGVRPLSAE